MRSIGDYRLSKNLDRMAEEVERLFAPYPHLLEKMGTYLAYEEFMDVGRISMIW